MRTCRSALGSSGGRCPMRGSKRSPLHSLTLRSVDEHHDILEPWRGRSAILRRDGRMPQQELGYLQGLRRSGIFKLQAATCPRLALLRGDGGRLTVPGLLVRLGAVDLGQRSGEGSLLVNHRFCATGGPHRRGLRRGQRGLRVRWDTVVRILGSKDRSRTLRARRQPLATVPAMVPLRGGLKRGGALAVSSDHDA